MATGKSRGKLREGFLPEDRLFALLETSQEDSRVQLYTPPGDLVQYSGNEANRESEQTEDKTSPTYTFTVSSDQNLSSPRRPNFLAWVRFEEATLPPRENVRRNSSITDIWKPLSKFRADLPGGVHIEGVDGLAESVHNLFHSARRLDFMEQHRALRLPLKPPEQSLPPMPRRELERLENELFDMTKYMGACQHLTALAWSEDGRTGSITLYEVDLDDRYRRQRDIPVGIRPVAAMTNVPKPVLIEMRKHERIKRKVVFVPSDEDGKGFKWTANPSRGPTYIKLPGSSDAEDRELSMVLAPPRSPVGSLREGRGSPSSYSGSPHSNQSRLTDADGVRATIPQFVALLHASRTILEDIESTSIDPLKIEDGKVLPTVKLTKSPRANSHEGGMVHVTVLIPSDSDWTDDQIFWTDADGLVEFRRRRYWDLIEWETRHSHREKSKRRHSSHSGHSSCSGHRDRSLSPRVRSRSQHRHGSRNNSRHLNLPSF